MYELLALSRKLDLLLRKDTVDNMDNIRIMSIYGVTFGYRSFHFLLKLTTNFIETSMR